MADGASSQSEITNLQSQIADPPSAFRAWCVLVVQSFQRHWRVRQMGWVAAGLLALCVVAVVVITARPGGWGLPERSIRRGVTYRQYAEQLLLPNRYTPPNRPTHAVEAPSPLDPTRDALQSLVLSVPHAVLGSEKFLSDWAFMNFSRWV